MDHNLKKYQTAFLIITIAQFFMMLSLLQYGGAIKALSGVLAIFALFQDIAFIMMIVAATKLYEFNKKYFYSFITSIICLFVTLLYTVAKESTEDMTVAWSRGLNVSSDILLCIAYAYFFLGSKDKFNELNLEKNVKRSRLGFFVVITITIVINLMSFFGSFNFVKTNYLVAAIFKYGGIAMRFVMYTFMFVIILVMKIDMKKNIKEEPHEEQK